MISFKDIVICYGIQAFAPVNLLLTIWSHTAWIVLRKECFLVARRGDDITEYAVYTVDKSSRSNDNHPMWERKHTTRHKNKAIARAKVLYKSRHYDRVEVKKKTRTHGNVYRVQDDYRVYEINQAQRRFRQMLISMACCALTIAGFWILALL